VLGVSIEVTPRRGLGIAAGGSTREHSNLAAVEVVGVFGSVTVESMRILTGASERLMAWRAPEAGAGRAGVTGDQRMLTIGSAHDDLAFENYE